MEHPIEGDELLLKDRSLWIVKGCYHPENGLVAIPRVVCGEKLKTLGSQLRLIKRYYPHYLKKVPEIGLPTPVVPLKDILKYIRVETAPTINSYLSSLSYELREVLERSCRTECGITGSLLGNYLGEHSDIDVVCVDNENFPECLKDLRAKGLLNPMGEEDFFEEYNEVSEAINYDLHKDLVRLKLTQGLFKGVRYTLKVINCRREKNLLGPYINVFKGELLVKLLSTDYRSPSIYEVQILRPKTYVRSASLLTYRVRFAELPEGTLIRGEGYLLYKDMKHQIITFDRPPSRIEFIILPR